MLAALGDAAAAWPIAARAQQRERMRRIGVFHQATPPMAEKPLFNKPLRHSAAAVVPIAEWNIK